VFADTLAARKLTGLIRDQAGPWCAWQAHRPWGWAVAEFLVHQGIDSISLTPDRVVETIRLVARIETEAGNGG